MNVAKKLFGEKGFETTSIRDISKRAKVNVAMIAYYFGCKEKLYTTCLADFSVLKSKLLKETLVAPVDADDFRAKLKKVLDVLMQSYSEDSAMLKLLMREMQNQEKEINQELFKLTSPFFYSFRDFFQMAIDAKIISKSKSADYIAIVFVGAFSKPIHSEAAVKKVVGKTMQDLDFQKKYKEHLLDIFIDGVLK